MDAHQTYLAMLAAMHAGDDQTARELALALQNWFAQERCKPLQDTTRAIRADVASVLGPNASDTPEPTFSLVCLHCDAGMGIESEIQAIRQGWSEIELAVGLSQANYTGLCPDCRLLEE